MVEGAASPGIGFFLQILFELGRLRKSLASLATPSLTSASWACNRQTGSYPKTGVMSGLATQLAFSCCTTITVMPFYHSRLGSTSRNRLSESCVREADLNEAAGAADATAWASE